MLQFYQGHVMFIEPTNIRCEDFFYNTRKTLLNLSESCENGDVNVNIVVERLFI